MIVSNLTQSWTMVGSTQCWVVLGRVSREFQLDFQVTCDNCVDIHLVLIR